MLATATFAQVSPSKQINHIKRDNAYLYAEATMDSAEEAMEVARELLMQQVQAYAGTQRRLNDANDVLVKNVNAKCESLSMMRGTMHRVFVYVKKNDIEGVSNVTTINQSTKTATEVVEQPVPPVVAPAKPVETAKTEPVETAEPEQEAITVVGSLSDVVNLPEWQLQAITDLMGCSDINAVRAKLNRMKAEFKIKKFGTPDKCPSASEAYWIVFDDFGGVNTILGPGTTDRLNFRELEESSLDQFKGKTAIWFNFAK